MRGEHGRFGQGAHRPDAPTNYRARKELPAIASATAASSIATEPRAFFLRPGLVDGDVTPGKICSVERLHRCLRFGTGTHLHKSKTFGPSGEFIGNDPRGLNGAVRSEEILKLFIGGVVGQSTDIEFVSHVLLLSGTV